ncbi:carboxymuconolactone decarboxylase family protein [Streptomonospora nanhaiensis]|uniref:carboxymuconolactone decarboxylase family protein n=1 Tax=Streptomonospora nanhaiensis TaxID=1323731 RepID=UPI001C3929D3|nr:carboxymuconolactone decarboxylase family protein [Streptomonospora nanhaiensis]MBV2364505.1 carboxymuconolactone decarboxylase family protein [Streptomonospora nanhaiensis]MBX9388036.1 carboxymuconolactone decarboxylase family protein [Streptomonospora nanhaiensis]
MEPRFNLFDSPTAAKFAKRMHAAGMVTEGASLPKTTQELVRLRISQINGCGLCVDIHTKEAAAAGETPLRLSLVPVWREATVFTEAERAALALAEEGTRLADAHHGVSDATWAEVRRHFDDDQIGALIAVIAMINAANRMNVIVRNAGGSYEPGMMAGALD